VARRKGKKDWCREAGTRDVPSPGQGEEEFTMVAIPSLMYWQREKKFLIEDRALDGGKG